MYAVFTKQRTINAGKTPNKNEDQAVAGMFCLNVSKSSNEADDRGSPTLVTQVIMVIKGIFCT